MKGGGLAGAKPPPGSDLKPKSNGKMKIYFTIWNSSYFRSPRGDFEVPRGSRGVLGRSWGGPRAQGRSRGALGGSRGVPGVSLKIVILTFLGGEFCIRLMKYWCFRFGVVLWNGLLHHRWYCFLLIFQGMYFENRWGENSGNPCVCVFFLIFINFASSNS